MGAARERAREIRDSFFFEISARRRTHTITTTSTTTTTTIDTRGENRERERERERERKDNQPTPAPLLDVVLSEKTSLSRVFFFRKDARTQETGSGCLQGLRRYCSLGRGDRGIFWKTRAETPQQQQQQRVLAAARKKNTLFLSFRFFPLPISPSLSSSQPPPSFSHETSLWSGRLILELNKTKRK